MSPKSYFDICRARPYALASFQDSGQANIDLEPNVLNEQFWNKQYLSWAQPKNSWENAELE